MARSCLAAGVAGLLLLASHLAFAQAGGIKGQDAMGDKDRAGPDGWVQAPIPRVDSPSGSAPGEGKSNRSADSKVRDVPDTGKALPPGENPGTPMATPNGPAARTP